MEIERKYLISSLPEHLEQYPHRQLEQGYLSTSPVVRVRKDDDKYELTYNLKDLWFVKNTIFHSQRNPMNICALKSTAD